jgi:hypothetical protein
MSRRIQRDSQTSPWGGFQVRDYYGAILNILGSPSAIIPMGENESGDTTTVNTKGLGAGSGLVFTYSEARRAFDRHYGRVRGQGRVPVIPFNGVDEILTSPDAAFWTPVSGGVDIPFSVGYWLRTGDYSGSRFILYKAAAVNTDEEFRLYISGNGVKEDVVIELRDASAAVTVSCQSDAELSLNSLHFVVVTYDGSGGATAANGIAIYLNGKVWASTATNNASYVAMKDGAGLMRIGDRLGSRYFKDILLGGPLGPFYCQKQLSAAEVYQLHSIGRDALRPLPSGLYAYA